MGKTEVTCNEAQSICLIFFPFFFSFFFFVVFFLLCSHIVLWQFRFNEFYQGDSFDKN